jgi:tRNA(fMet)-specific endonuclease VapC
VSALLLDTDVFSYLFKDHPFAEAYRPILKGHVLAISFMTVAELFQGAFRAGWGAKRIERLEGQIGSYLVLQSSPGNQPKLGRSAFPSPAPAISAEDAWIAATALEYDWPLVTHNSDDFQGIPDLKVITHESRR